MISHAPAIVGTGLASSVGLSAAASCAAIRAKLTNPVETRFVDAAGEWIKAHRTPLGKPWTGRTRLRKMAVRAIRECLADVPRTRWAGIPMFLCVAERDRPGRTPGLEESLLGEVSAELEVQFADGSEVIPLGRIGATVALLHARRLMEQGRVDLALVVGTDSLLDWPTVSAYERAGRLLTSINSDGFIPGEAAGALLLGSEPRERRLVCAGLGFGTERASIDSGLPLRGDGLTGAIRSALDEAGRQMHELDLRISDLSGEQYYFKEASLALARSLRLRKEELQLWHHAESIGECGAAGGIASFVLASAACRKSFAPGPRVLCQSSNDSGERAVAILEYR